MNEDLTDFIIKELSRPIERRKIIQRVSKKSGLNWKEAERLVTLLEARYYRTSATGHTPVLLCLSIGALFLGIGLLAYNLEFLVALFQQDVLGQTLSRSGGHTVELLGGIGITAGGMLGLWKALGTIFPN